MAAFDSDILSPIHCMHGAAHAAHSAHSAHAAHSTRAVRAARAARTEHVRSLIDNLITLVDTFTVVAGYSSNPKHQLKLTKDAENTKKKYFEKIGSLRQNFDVFSNPSQKSTSVATFIRDYNTRVNWLNMLTMQICKLDKAARDKLSDFEKFVVDHRFPMYDFTNGFESDVDVDARIMALMNTERKDIVSKSDGVTFNHDDEQPKFFLKESLRSVIVATSDHDYFMAAIKAGIENATLLDSHDELDESDDPYKLRKQGKQSTSRFDGRFGDLRSHTQNGRLDHYGLLLRYHDSITSGREIRLPSTCQEITRRFTTVDDVAEFNKLCIRRIVSLLISRDPEHHLNEIVVFCQHPNCNHSDGFLYRKHPVKPEDYHRVGSACPSGHAFCLRCLQQDHEGFCQDMRQEREELAAMPGQKMCPTCRTIIFKNGGCNHMHCTYCDQHFCWTCSARFSSSEQYRIHGTCQQFD